LLGMPLSCLLWQRLSDAALKRRLFPRRRVKKASSLRTLRHAQLVVFIWRIGAIDRKRLRFIVHCDRGCVRCQYLCRRQGSGSSGVAQKAPTLHLLFHTSSHAPQAHRRRRTRTAKVFR